MKKWLEWLIVVFLYASMDKNILAIVSILIYETKPKKKLLLGTDWAGKSVNNI